MAHSLAKEQKRFIVRMVGSGRFNNQSEVVREALRRMETQELDYLNPPALTAAQEDSIYGTNGEREKLERDFGRAAFRSLRRAGQKGKRP